MPSKEFLDRLGVATTSVATKPTPTSFCTCPAMTGAAGFGPKYQPCANCGLVRRCKICLGCRRCRPDNPLRGRVFPRERQ